MSTTKPAKRRQPGDGKAAEQKKQLAKAKKAVKEREETTIRTHAYQCGAHEEAAEHQVRVGGEARHAGQALRGAAAVREEARPRQGAHGVRRRPGLGLVGQHPAARVRGGAGAQGRPRAQLRQAYYTVSVRCA